MVDFAGVFFFFGDYGSSSPLGTSATLSCLVNVFATAPVLLKVVGFNGVIFMNCLK